MNINEVITLESTNADKIYLLKEGFFWRAYERSAFRFVKHIRPYQVIKKQFKKVKMDVCFIGFPENMLEEMLKLQGKENLVIVAKTKAQVTIALSPLSFGEGLGGEAEFNEWKTSCVIPAARDEKWFIQKIKEYPVFTKTPLETVQFVAEMQERLNIEKPTAAK